MWASFLLVMLAGLVTADIPCSLYDVTTLRVNGTSENKYEIHSRSNAVGRQTNYESITGLTDPLENLSCRFKYTEACPGWQMNGFHQVPNDPVLDWDIIGRPKYERYENVQIDERGGSESRRNLRVYQYSVPDEGALQITLKKEQHGQFFAVVAKHEFPTDGFEFKNDLHQNKLQYQQRHFKALSKHGKHGQLENIHWPYMNVPSDVLLQRSFGSIDLPSNGDVVRVFVRKENGKVCIWAENAYRSNVCLYIDSSEENGISVVTSEDDEADFDVYQYAYPLAMRLSGTEGSATLNTTTTDPSRKLCISLRYFLEKDEAVNVKFLAGSAPKKLIHSSNLEGKGGIVSEVFSMIIPESQEQESLHVTFETESNSSFTLHSARRCSAKDRDVITMKAASVCSTEFCQRTNPTETLKEIGFGVKCPLGPKKSGLAKKCYNGGINDGGWCQCLPGFTGPSCERACPPGRFGRDCGGKCIDSPDCEGVSLAAAYQPFECARGLYGPECNKTCEDGFYGPNCRLECGQCLHGTCNRFTGSCNGPCKRGSIGQTCQDHLATVDKVEIVSTTFDSAEGVVSVTSLSESELQSYPYVKLLYAKMPVPENLVFETVTPLSWSGLVLSLNSSTVQFKLDSLDYDEKYYVQALLIHKSGDFYSSSWDANPHAVFSTSCILSTFDSVDVLSEDESLSVAWKVTESDLYPCQIRGFQLEIYLPEMDSPLKKYMSPYETNTTINAVLPQDGSFRLGATFETKDTVWTYHEFSIKESAEVTRELNIVDKSIRSMDFSWLSSDDLSEDVLVCEPEQVLCVDRKLENKTQRVRKRQFTIKGLSPFTTYVCTLEHSGLQAIAMTQPDQPTGSPRPHDQPVQVTNTTASIQWTNADCVDINGLAREFRIELWRGTTNEATITTTVTTFKTSFDGLIPETSYEARIYVVNQLGWNAAYFLSIPFKTKSTTPNAVSDLLVYKRTRNDLWLRWLPPDTESNDTIVIGYKVTASAPEVETQESEIASVQCTTWPDYFCHRLRSLVPDIEYNIQVQAKNNKVDLFGPPTVTKAMTKEGVPDAPVDVRVYNRTATSVVLTWEVPLRLNSNPKFFFVTLEQTDENNSQENPTDPVDSKVLIVEGQRIYEVKFDQLNPATTYVATISAGLRGQRSMLTVNTPPKDPPSPPAPTVDETSGIKRVVFHGIRSKPEFVKLLSGYLLLAATDNTVKLNHGITDPDLAASIQSQLGDNVYVAHEFAPSLTDEVFNFENETAVPGNFSLLQNVRLEPGHEYRFALAAISTYCGANAVAVSPVLTFKN